MKFRKKRLAAGYRLSDRNGRRLVLLLVILTGIFAGTSLPELLRMGNGSYAGFFSLYSFEKYEMRELRPMQLLPYILRVRLQTILFLWMSSYTPAGVFVHLSYAWWLAASGGMLLSMFALRSGVHGLVLFVCCLFPQWILYTEAYRREGARLLGASFGELLPGQEDSLSPEAYRSRRYHRGEIQNLAEILGLCTLGCACEAFLGMWILKFFLQYFT